MCPQNLPVIGSKIGEAPVVDCNPDPMIKYIHPSKVLVLINVHTPLFPVFYSQQNDGSKLWIGFCYDELSTLCYQCGILGQEEDECSND